MFKLVNLLVILFSVSLLSAQESDRSVNSKINFQSFTQLTNEVQIYRKQRLVDLEKFIDMSNDENTLILDTRSKSAYAKKHIKGAKHLNFSDFTENNLAQIIPNKQTRILIYCNNNFLDDPQNFALKKIDLALNIPTFINLYGYGYKNIFELSELISVSDPDLEFSDSRIK